MTIGVGIFNNVNNKMKQNGSKNYLVYTVKDSPALQLTGKIDANQVRSLNTPSGVLKQLNVSDGQLVKTGEVLMLVTNQEAQEAVDNQNDVVNRAIKTVNSTNTSLKDAQQIYNQSSDDEKSATKSSLTQAQQSYNEAKDLLIDAQNKLVELKNKVTSSVISPFDGIVTVDRDTKDGVPSITINSLEKELKANISEYDYSKVHTGDTITISSIDGNVQEQATINSISQLPTKQSKETAYYPFSAKVNSDFLYGQSVKVQVNQNVVKIPKSAVYRHQIYKIIDGKVSPIKADVTPSGGSYIVNSGVVVGEKIVRNPDDQLKKDKSIND